MNDMPGFYRYFLIGSSNVVRVTYNADGLKIGAEYCDPETGKLAIRNTLLSRIDDGSDVEEIDMQEFDARCAAAGRRTH